MGLWKFLSQNETEKKVIVKMSKRAFFFKWNLVFVLEPSFAFFAT